MYEHFLILLCALRILLDPQCVKTDWVKTAKELLLHIVNKMLSLYGKESLIYNVHNLIHLPDDVVNLSCTLLNFR